MNCKRIIKFFLVALSLVINIYADEVIQKQAIKSNYQISYNKKQVNVNNFSDMLVEGNFYGRVRSNTFYFIWKNDDIGHDTQIVNGLGGSLLHKSATFNDFDFTTALYYSRAFFNETKDPVNAFKPAKDTLSRFNYANTGKKSLEVIGQAYLSYKILPKTKIKLGRQIVETFYTRSNDSKMIPNTFDGVVLSSKDFSSTSVKLAYLYKQKLRDHEKSHAILMTGDSSSSSSLVPQWSENDDAVMHDGLTYSALVAAGKSTNAPLISGDFHNKSVKNLKINTSFYIVPKLISQVMGELNYKLKLGNKFWVVPGIRYIKQFDNGAGGVGGASYINDTTGYKNPDSLNSQMVAARLVTTLDKYKINLGYSQIFDEADLITPWRGFPTSGYTRSMGRYNWRANTKSYRLQIQKNQNQKGVYKDLFIQASVLYTDGDDAKVGAHILDEIYYYMGFIQNIPSIVNLQWRFRLGYTSYLDSIASKYDNIDSRFELNYLF